MSSKIRKRSGHQVPFDMEKIYAAVDKAFEAAGKKTPATFKSILNQNSNKFKTAATVERIQDEIENLLLSCGHIDVYKKFSTYRGQRAIMREMKQSEVFKSIVNLENNDITNDNANMSATSPAGMMYKFGAESTKAFAKQYILNPKYTKEMNDGYIHIHDLDHLAFSDFNCISENAYITIKDETGAVINTTLSFFNKFFTDDSQQVIELPQNYWIKGRNDWTLINKISRRKISAGDVLYKIKCNKGVGLDVTENHLIPVIRDDKEVLLRAKDIKVGDSFLKPASFDLNLINHDYIDIIAELRRLDLIDGIYIYNVKQLNNYLRYKYDKGLWQLLGRRSNHLRYIKLEEYIKIIDNYDIPYEVIQTMQVAVMNGKTKLPLYLPITNELAEVVGYLHSEGSVSFVSDATTHKRSYAVTFCNKDEQIINKYKLAWKKSIGTRLGDYINKQGCHLITASSRLLCLLFSKILGGKNHAYDIAIPDFIFNANDDIKWHYISALIDGDGCISNSCKTIRYSTICEKFAEQLVILLNSVGIESSINTSFIDGRTVYFGENRSRSHGDIYNVVISHRQYVEKALDSLCCIKQRSVDAMYASKQISAVTCEPNKIKSIIQSSDTPYVFDLETVEHWFVVNNIVVHNCLQSPMDKILRDGFSAGHGSVRGAKRIETAAFLMMIALETTQNEMFGGQGVPAFDFYLAPFVRKAYEQEIDKIAETIGWPEDLVVEYKDYPIVEYAEHYDDKYVNLAMKRVVDRVHQSMESFVHNANSIHSRGGRVIIY